MDVGTFQHRLANANRGDRIIYHTGDLLYERQYGTDGHGRGASPISQLAREVWKAHMDGKVALTQQRIGKSLWAYIATRLDPAHPKKITYFGCYADDPPQMKGTRKHEHARGKNQDKVQAQAA